MARIKLIFAVVILLVLAILAMQNSAEVPVKLLFYNWQVPGTLLILMTALVGFSIGIIYGARIPRRVSVTRLPSDSSSEEGSPSAAPSDASE